jgi:hypothetical protein
VWSSGHAIPKAIAPKAPCRCVNLHKQLFAPGKKMEFSGPTTCTVSLFYHLNLMQRKFRVLTAFLCGLRHWNLVYLWRWGLLPVNVGCIVRCILWTGQNLDLTLPPLSKTGLSSLIKTSAKILKTSVAGMVGLRVSLQLWTFRYEGLPTNYIDFLHLYSAQF